MIISDLTNKTVGIIGVGQEGQAIARYLVLHGLKPTIFDEKEYIDWPEEIRNVIAAHDLNYRAGAEYLSSLSEQDVIFRSPGFRRLHPALVEAEQKGATITSQTKWFFKHCPAKIVGVTGTKGKGTTTALLYEILKSAHTGEVYLTGNIGKQQPLDFLENLTPADVVAYELSSFQLQDLTQSPNIGICLMVTSDHLDHHQSLEEYHQAKTAITAFQTAEDISISNIDYTPSKWIGEQGQGQKLLISAQQPVAHGAKIEGETIILNLSSKQLSIDCTNRLLRGRHNLENIAAASLAAASLGISQEAIQETVEQFKGLEHRLQFVAVKNGVGYYNDSISTVPDTTIAAVNSFAEPVVVIVGGSDKGIPFDGLAKFLTDTEKVKAVITLGQTGAVIKQLLANAGKPVLGPFSSMTEAVKTAAEQAAAGDVVILSPATASFDMFKNYADRGQQFATAVETLHG